MNSVPKQAQKQEDRIKRGGISAELILEVNSKRRDKSVQSLWIYRAAPGINKMFKYILSFLNTPSFSRVTASWLAGSLAGLFVSEPFYHHRPAWLRKIEAADRQETQSFTVQGNHSAACCNESWWSMQKDNRKNMTELSSRKRNASWTDSRFLSGEKNRVGGWMLMVKVPLTETPDIVTKQNKTKQTLAKCIFCKLWDPSNLCWKKFST